MLSAGFDMGFFTSHNKYVRDPLFWTAWAIKIANTLTPVIAKEPGQMRQSHCYGTRTQYLSSIIRDCFALILRSRYRACEITEGKVSIKPTNPPKQA